MDKMVVKEVTLTELGGSSENEGNYIFHDLTPK